MENLGPVILFVLYMVISAWSKQKKNQRFQERKEQYLDEEEGQAPPPPSKVESIFDQLKKELFEEEEILPPPFMEQVEEVPEPPVEEFIPEDYTPAEIADERPFLEGSRSLDENPDSHHLEHLDDIGVTQATRKKTLGEVLRPYSTIQQGIILHEILGKPRAMQPDEDWFHSH